MNKLVYSLWLLAFLPYTLLAQVNADFSVNTQTGCGTLQASFTDLSTATGTSITGWSWDLGGVNSTQQNPGRIFGTPGNYTICLTVVAANGQSDTECKTDFITVYPLPNPSIAATTPTSGCPPLTVGFLDQSTSSGEGIITWIWGVNGELGVYNGQGPFTNTYTLVDSFDISLTVVDANGCSNTRTFDDFVQVYNPPQIDVTANTPFGCNVPFVTTFTNNNIESNVNYAWQFGNGQFHVGAIPPPVTYAQVGTYDVRIFATNVVTGCRDTLLLDNAVTVGLSSGFTFTTDGICDVVTAIFTDTTSTVADSVRWDFGDGTFSTAPNPTHVYNDAGCYDVTLYRYSNGCLSQSTSATCIENVNPPVASYSVGANPEHCNLPRLYTFTGNSPTPAAITNWHWEFGEGGAYATANVRTPTITFDEYGIFPVYLTVTDTNNCQTRIVLDTVKMIETQAVIPDAIRLGCAPLSVPLVENAVSVSPISSWEWTVYNANDTLTATTATPTMVIPDTGLYSIRLVITNTLGCRDTAFLYNEILVGQRPEVNFSASPLVTCVGSNVQFTDLSSDFVDYWLWNFGDDVTSLDQHPLHAYADTGTYTVRLLVAHNGCFLDTIFENLIRVLPPRASFDYTRSCIDYTTITLNNTSIGADSIFWDFGIPNITTDTSSLLTPTVTFPDTGIYTVTLTAFNFTTQCSHSTSADIIINTPQALFALDTLRGCAPLTIRVTNNSIFGASYQWSANGGQVSDPTAATPSITYNTPGTYTGMSLIVADQFGCLDTLQTFQTVEVGGVNAEFTVSDSTGCLPHNVRLTSTATSVLQTITNWQWSIANGWQTATTTNFSTTLDSVGLFIAQLTATDTWGCTDVATHTILVNQPLPSFTQDTAACGGQLINFVNTTPDAGNTYLWQFGDGMSATDATPAYAYNTEGIFRPCLQVTDSIGCMNTFCGDSIRINNPVAAFTADTTRTDCPPLFVNFQNLSQHATEYLWDLGNTQSNTVNPPDIYTYPGIYDVQLIAFNGICADTVRVDSFIRIGGPRATFTYAVDSSCFPVRVRFTGQSELPYTYVWDFGNGVLDTGGVNVVLDTLSYFYTQSGNYVPKLIVVAQGAIGECLVTIESPDTIRLPEFTFDFITNDTAFCNETAIVNYSILTTSMYNNLSWEFSGANIQQSSSLEPQVTYTAPGDYPTYLIVSNDFCTDTLRKDIRINIDSPPEPNFSFNPLTGCAPMSVTFIDQTTVNFGAVAAWQWDFDGLGTATTATPTFTFETAGTYTVSLRVTTGGGCQDSIALPITVNSLTPFSIAQPDSICIGDTVQLSVLAASIDGATFAWTGSTATTTLSCTNCLMPRAFPSSTTTYTLQFTNANNCVSTQHVTVPVRPQARPTINIPADTTICCATALPLSVTGGAFYEWNTAAAGLSCYDCANPTVTLPNMSQTYVVTVFNVPACSSVDSIVISCVVPDNNLLPDDISICAGDSTTLSIDHGTNPIWSPPTMLSCINCPDPTAFPTDTMQYIVQVNDGPCLARDTIHINIVPLGGIDAGVRQEICLGAETTLLAMGNGEVTWSPDMGIDDVHAFMPNVSPTTDTWYVLALRQGECVQYDSVLIEVIDRVTISAPDVTICARDTAQLLVEGDADAYTWLTPDGLVLSSNVITNPIAIPSETAVLTVIGTRSTCEPDTAYVNLTVQPTPTILMNAVYNYFPGVEVFVQPNITGGSGSYSYQWLPTAGLSCYTCPSPQLQLQASSWYTLEVTDNATGCSRLDSTYMNLLKSCGDELIQVPNAFSPNGDTYNDELKIITRVIDEIYTFIIFDRWGEKVFETKNIDEGWNGTLDGKPLNPGVFVYYIEFACKLDGTKVYKTGDVTLLR